MPGRRSALASVLHAAARHTYLHHLPVLHTHVSAPSAPPGPLLQCLCMRQPAMNTSIRHWLSCLRTYPPSGSGKTLLLEGSRGKERGSPEGGGLVHLALDELFKLLAEKAAAVGAWGGRARQCVHARLLGLHENVVDDAWIHCAPKHPAAPYSYSVLPSSVLLA